MSKIGFYKDTQIDYARKDALQEKINIVLKKIHTYDDDINWYIFDNNNTPNMSSFEKIIGEHYGRFFIEKTPPFSFFIKNISKGLACPSAHTIWIHKNAINPITAPFYLHKVNDRILGKVYGAFERDTLADIIMDEIAHIRTGKDHNDIIYERTLQEYRNNYYK